MSNFQQDPWRPGAAVQPAAVAPVQEDPPTSETEPVAEVPQETPPPSADTETPPPADDATDDELERALAEMRGEA